MVDTLPPDLRKLRACLLCKLIKNFDLFKTDGCDNCEALLHMRGSNDQVLDCTTTNFTGFVAMAQPKDGSWVARWLRIEKAAKGCYAMKVFGSLPEEIVEDLNGHGIEYPFIDE